MILINNIITIGREFGSGGKEIGSKLAKRLDIPCYDKKLIAIAAKQSGICEDIFYENDEKKPGSFIAALAMGSYPINEANTIYPNLPLNNKVFLAQFDTIKSIAAEGPCVIIGRCADYVLKDTNNLTKIYVTADMEWKKQRVIKRDNISANKVEDYIKKIDKKRAAHYKYYTDTKWGTAKNYDLCINSSKIGIEKSVDIIENYIKMILD